LDTVQPVVAGHGVEIGVDSMPGKTICKMRLPIDGPSREPSNDDHGG
jgi:hypothetical protein